VLGIGGGWVKGKHSEPFRMTWPSPQGLGRRTNDIWLGQCASCTSLLMKLLSNHSSIAHCMLRVTDSFVKLFNKLPQLWT